MSEYIKLNDEVRFPLHVHNPAASGQLINADETPRWYVMEQDSDTPILQGNFVNRGITGSYRGSFFASGVLGFDAGNYYEVHASGKVGGLLDRIVCKSFVLNDLYNVNIIQVSGQEVNINSFKEDTIYFALILFIKDTTNLRDEYVAQWFRGGIPINSGDITNPAISVYNTLNGTSLFQNQTMNYANTDLGVVRYNDSNFLAVSGEPYLVVVSGTIDSVTRVFNNVVGLDIF